MFSRRFARRMARLYGKRGLDRTARRIVGFLEEQVIEGATVLEVGGGVGEIQIELLKRGAERAVNLELSPAYEPVAEQLLRETGFADRVQRKLHDIAVDPHSIEPADVVVLHRVVCCYPDHELLLGAAAAHARHVLVFSHPRRHEVTRVIMAAQNLGFRVMRREFRGFIHEPAEMLDVLGAHGLNHTFARKGVFWQVNGLVRSQAGR